MDIWGVKKKVTVAGGIVTLAVATFLLSWLAVFPSGWIERLYSRRLFPLISHRTGFVGDIVPFSWLDVALPVALAILIYTVVRRRWRLAAAAISVAYLWFFWTWGLNYHRERLEASLALTPRDVQSPQIAAFVRLAATELNRLWPQTSKMAWDWGDMQRVANARVRRVVGHLDGVDWVSTSRVKRSLLAQGWFRIAGVEGVFNPFGHEPVVSSSLLPFEYPFVMAHELAHVRGIANEGDANLIGVLATLASDDPRFQYSGWFQLWLYLGNSERDNLLAPGPRNDLRLFANRVRSQQIEWANNLQSAILDWHLRANRVPEGTGSYSRFVLLSIASQPSWNDYR